MSLAFLHALVSLLILRKTKEKVRDYFTFSLFRLRENRIHENSTYKQIAFFKLQIAIKCHFLCKIILRENLVWCYKTVLSKLY